MCPLCKKYDKRVKEKEENEEEDVNDDKYSEDDLSLVSSSDNEDNDKNINNNTEVKEKSNIKENVKSEEEDMNNKEEIINSEEYKEPIIDLPPPKTAKKRSRKVQNVEFPKESDSESNDLSDTKTYSSRSSSKRIRKSNYIDYSYFIDDKDDDNDLYTEEKESDSDY